MNRAMNVSLVMTLAATLACAPASRRQTQIKAPADTSKQKPGANNGSGSTQTIDAAVPSPALASSHINGVRIFEQTGTALIVGVGIDKDAKNQVYFKISLDGKTITPSNAAAVKAGSMSYVCNDGTSATSTSCQSADFKFTLANNIAMDAALTLTTNVPVTEVVMSSDNSQSSSAKQVFGAATYRKIVLSEVAGGASVTGYFAKVTSSSITSTTNTAPDDIESSKDGNSKIVLFGFPTTDPSGAKISPVTPTTKTSDGKISARTEEDVAMVSDTQLSYSRLISSDGKNTSLNTILVLSVNLGDISNTVLAIGTASAPDSASSVASNDPSAANGATVTAAPAANSQPAVAQKLIQDENASSKSTTPTASSTTNSSQSKPAVLKAPAADVTVVATIPQIPTQTSSIQTVIPEHPEGIVSAAPAPAAPTTLEQKVKNDSTQAMASAKTEAQKVQQDVTAETSKVKADYNSLKASIENSVADFSNYVSAEWNKFIGKTQSAAAQND